MTVRDMLSKLDSKELTEWMAFFKIENDEIKRAKDGPPLQEKMQSQLRGYGKMSIE